MNRAAAVLAAMGATALIAQMGRNGDWVTFGGDPQRSGWAKVDGKFTKDEVKNFQLLWKFNIGAPSAGMTSVMPPVICCSKRLGRALGAACALKITLRASGEMSSP